MYLHLCSTSDALNQFWSSNNLCDNFLSHYVQKDMIQKIEKSLLRTLQVKNGWKNRQLLIFWEPFLMFLSFIHVWNFSVLSMRCIYLYLEFPPLMIPLAFWSFYIYISTMLIAYYLNWQQKLYISPYRQLSELIIHIIESFLMCDVISLYPNL